ncbi:hypothetical protein G7Z17_g3948 [Cylindrodendrum hubeiense]|uniref:Monocarboxylate transporter n=1 Tax=Cylindrodendrum hubeiense TaxID=595255 RepID=A0A9P5LIU3_9HYPO|nr:hypothetical protein G7Z17_g3948 [Cylindrodendrum hubeiense]
MNATQVESSVELESLSLPHNTRPVSQPGAEREVDDLRDQLGRVQDFHDPDNEVSLPPADGGKKAWLFLAACFFVEGLIWGFPLAFGVFQSYYSTHAPFAGSKNISVIGTCSTGAMYFAAPAISSTLRIMPWHARWAPTAGLLIACFALAMSSFSTTVPQLIATQGFLYGLGGAIAYIPCIMYMDEWFIRRKGFAFGYGSDYGSLIVFTGVTAFLGGIAKDVKKGENVTISVTAI